MPRELRDLIYSHLLGENIHLEARESTEREQSLHKKIPVLNDLLACHYTQASYVGTQCHSELIARFYETATLRIIDVILIDGYHVLRDKEPFGVPVMFGERIRDVTFVIQDPQSWDGSNHHIVFGLTAMEQLADRGCKINVRLEQEANITLARVRDSALHTVSAFEMR